MQACVKVVHGYSRAQLIAVLHTLHKMESDNHATKGVELEAQGVCSWMYDSWVSRVTESCLPSGALEIYSGVHREANRMRQSHRGALRQCWEFAIFGKVFAVSPAAPCPRVFSIGEHARRASDLSLELGGEAERKSRCTIDLCCQDC